MTIFEGTDGSINLFWNDLFISSIIVKFASTEGTENARYYWYL